MAGAAPPTRVDGLTPPRAAADRPRVAVLVPCRNEAVAIGKVVADFRAALLELIKNLPQFDFDGVLEEIEYAIHCLERYVQPWLVLMVLLQRIQQKVQQQLAAQQSQGY